jgi:biotin carboxylase
MHRPLRVWYNENLSSTHNIVRLLQSVDESVRPFVFCTHSNPDCPAFEISDESALEPKGMDAADYLAHCLDFCRQHRIDVFVPGRGMKQVSDARAEFAAIGTGLVLAADSETMRLFDDKARFYRTVPPEVAEAPAFYTVNTAAAFSEACRALLATGHRVCFKPSQSTGGLGFHILDDRRDELRNLFNSEPIRLSTQSAERILSTQPEFRDLLVMEYLDGAEYSIDCLGQDGRLLRGVVRRKPSRVGGAQWLEDKPELIEIARRAAAHYGLGGIFNVQVRYAGGQPKLLEINPRMSGGLYLACLSGVNIPFWAVQVAAGRADVSMIPQARTGLKVQQQLREFVLENPVARSEGPQPEPSVDAQPSAEPLLA